MSIRYFFDKTAVIKRFKPVLGTDKTKLQSTATVEVNLQKLDLEAVEKVQGVFGNDYVLFVNPEVDIKEGDVVYCKETKERFSVKEIIKAEMLGIEHFKQVYISKLDEDNG